MSLGTMTKSAGTGQSPGAPTYHDLIAFAGDDAYATGGTAGFQDLVQALTNDGREVLAVVGQDCGGYVVAYDKANDKLKVYEAAADGNPLDEAANAADLSLTTFNVLVLSK